MTKKFILPCILGLILVRCATPEPEPEPEPVVEEVAVEPPPPPPPPKLEPPPPKPDGEGDPVQNLEEFNRHFSNMTTGRGEGMFRVKAAHCSVYNTPSQQGDVVGHLEKGDDVHAELIEGDWTKIGRYQYVLSSALRNRGFSTFPMGYKPKINKPGS